MKIATAMEAGHVDAVIPAQLEAAECLFIIDVEGFEVLEILSAENDKSVTFARATIDRDCEAIICGEIPDDAFEILSNACVTRFDGTGLTASQAVRMMNANQLPLFRKIEDRIEQ